MMSHSAFMLAFLGFPEMLILLALGLGGVVALVVVLAVVFTSRKQACPVPPRVPIHQRDAEQELRTLARLKDEGLITSEEFSAKKKIILGI